MNREKITMETICGGELQKQVDRAMEEVIENILDPHMNPTKARAITIKIVFKPDEEDPEDVTIATEVQMKLAPEIGPATRLFINKDPETGRVTAREHNRGEIKGQITFGDFKEEFDMDTGEIYAPELLPKRETM